MKTVNLFLSPHQDDELITLGIPVRQAIDCGQEVFIALMTDGGASAVQKTLEISGEDFICARDKEFKASCLALGIEEENIIIPENRLQDGKLSGNEIIPVIASVIESLRPFDRIIVSTLCPYGTNTQHRDHRALGNAVIKMKNDGTCGIDRIALFLEPYEFEKLPDGLMFKELRLKDNKYIQSALSSYGNSDYKIAYLSVPRELYFFKKSFTAYEFIGNKEQQGRLKFYFKKATLLTGKLMAYLSCKKVRLNPSKLTAVNYIYNRPDLYTDKYEIYQIRYQGKKHVVELALDKKPAELCIRLTDIPRDAVRILCKYIFKKHPEISEIKMQQVFFPTENTYLTNHFRIEFPDNIEDFEATLSKSKRKTLRRSLKILDEKFGGMDFEIYEGQDIPDEVVETYFKYKLLSHNRDYHMTPREYLDYYHVTHAYVFKARERIIAVYFDCEQCDIVNSENFSFDRSIEQVSLGLLVRDYSFKEMIRKHKKQVFLGGGSYNQKFLYNYIEDMTYENHIKSSDLINIKGEIKKALHKVKSKTIDRIIKKEAVLPQEYFYSQKKKAQKYELEAGLAFTKIKTAEEFEDFCRTYKSSIDKLIAFTCDKFPVEKEKLIKRFKDGSVFYAIYSKEACLSSGWLAYKHDFYISEVSAKIDMRDSEYGILYDFNTEAERRGKGYYPALLKYMQDDAPCEGYVIYTKPHNNASQRGITKAGFAYDGAFTSKNIGKYLKRFGYKIIR